MPTEFLAPKIRQIMADEDVSTLEVETSVTSKTGYKNVIEVKGKYQARIQIKGDGRGGVRKRRQYSLPGLFDWPLEAAQYLAYAKKNGFETFLDDDGLPIRQIVERKARSTKSKAPPADPAINTPMQPVFTIATPITFCNTRVPIAPVSALPMSSFVYTAPFAM